MHLAILYISIVLVKYIDIVPNHTAPQGNPKGFHYCSPDVEN